VNWDILGISIQTSYEANPASCMMGAKDFFSQDNVAWTLVLTILFHLVSSSRMVELYLHIMTHLHDIVINKLSRSTLLSSTFASN
jgi:hypothetical protein